MDETVSPRDSYMLRLPDGTSAQLSEHALARWQEYVCPLATRMYATQLLEHVVAQVGRLSSCPPGWLRVKEAEPDDQDRRYLVLDDFALPILLDDGQPRIIPTVVPRGSLTPGAREHRHRRRLSRAAHRRGQTMQGKSEGRRGDRRKRRDRMAPGYDLDDT